MQQISLVRTFPALICAALLCAGCGGGGGGGGESAGGGDTPVPTTLALQVVAPDLTGKTGQEVPIVLNVTGTGTVTTASTDVTVDAATYQAADGVGAASIPISGLPTSSAASYKWIDSSTIRVVYASATGTTGGSQLVSVPVKVVSESSPSTVALTSTRLNQ